MSEQNPKNLVKFWIVTIFAVLVLSLNSQWPSIGPLEVFGLKPQIESCHLRELELCTVGITSILQNPNGLPVNEAELKHQCDYMNDSMQCFDEYVNRCLSDLQYSTVMMFTNNLVDLSRDFCNTKSELRKNYTKNAACLRQFQRKYQRQCVTDFQVGFEGIHKTKNQLRLNTTCCNLNRLKECVLGRLEEECGDSALDMVEQLLEQIGGNVIGLSCRYFDPFGADCESLLPKIGTKPHAGRNTSAISRAISAFSNVRSQ